jgi:hypothetical protein
VRAGSSYQWRGSFITIRRPPEWYKALAVRDICEESCNSRTVQLPSSTSPYAPPVVLQTFSRRIEKSSLCGGVYCQKLDYYRYTHDMRQATFPEFGNIRKIQGFRVDAPDLPFDMWAVNHEAFRKYQRHPPSKARMPPTAEAALLR